MRSKPKDTLKEGIQQLSETENVVECAEGEKVKLPEQAKCAKVESADNSDTEKRSTRTVVACTACGHRMILSLVDEMDSEKEQVENLQVTEPDEPTDEKCDDDLKVVADQNESTAVKETVQVNEFPKVKNSAQNNQIFSNKSVHDKAGNQETKYQPHLLQVPLRFLHQNKWSLRIARFLFQL